MANPSDRLPRNPYPDATPESLYQAVGIACTAWERLDTAVATIYSQIVQSKAGAAEAAYGTITSARTRSEMLIASMDAALDPPNQLNKDLTKFIDRFGSMSGRRNDIVHGMVMSFTVENESMGYYLVPPYFHTRKNDRKAGAAENDDFEWMLAPYKYAFTAEQVMIYVSKFEDLRQEATKLIFRAQERRREIHGTPWPESFRAQDEQ